MQERFENFTLLIANINRCITKIKTGLERYVVNNHEVLQTEKDAPTYILGGTIGTHVGPGAIGVAYFSKN